MGVDPNLLTKAAKVYEAAEALDGEKPKTVYESHKKCAPNEFGMNKEGGKLLQRAIAAIAGQKTANEAWKPFAAPPPGVPYAIHTLPKSDATAKNWQGAPSAPPSSHPSFQGAGGGAPPAPQPDLPLRKITPQQIQNANTDYGRLPLRHIPSQNDGQYPLRPIPQQQQPSPAVQSTFDNIAARDTAPMQVSRPAPKANSWLDTVRTMHNSVLPEMYHMKGGSLRSAIANAAHQKQGTDLYNAFFGPDVFTPGRSALMGAGAGGVAGAGLGGVLGGLYGLADPGNESVYASDGHVKGLKRRSRLMGALRGLAGGGALGAGAGAAVGGGVGYVNADLLEDARRRGEFENLMNRG